MKITVIGAGNMGGALIKGWNKNGKDIQQTIVEVDKNKLELFKAECPGINTSTDGAEAIKDAEIIIIAVKPWLVEKVINTIKPNLTSKQLLVSIAGGVTISQVQEYLTNCEMPKVFHVIPNIAAEFCESMSFVSAAKDVDKSDIEKVESLFKCVGNAIVCDEKLINPGMLLASCGLAYVMRFLRAQTQAGVEMGFYPKDALNIAMQTMQGAVSLLRETGEHPEAAIDRVTTPGGFTIKGLNEMDHAGFSSAVIKAFKTGF